MKWRVSGIGSPEDFFEVLKSFKDRNLVLYIHANDFVGRAKMAGIKVHTINDNV
jgi:hypothetical protein